MGSTSTQGWCLLAFLLGFTLLPAGLFGLGWIATLAGLALLVAAASGFRSIRQQEEGGPRAVEVERPGRTLHGAQP
jgi:hypothetical protein